MINLYKNIIDFFYDKDIEIDPYNILVGGERYGDLVIKKIDKKYDYRNIKPYHISYVSTENSGLTIKRYVPKNDGTLVLESYTYKFNDHYKDKDFIELYRQFYMCYNRLLHINKIKSYNK